MGVTSLVARLATTRVHVLVVETPGRSLLRMNAQAAIAKRGWVEATGPADADALLICGAPDRELRELIQAVWDQIPSPRHQALVDTEQSLDDILDAIPVALQNNAQQQTDARRRRLRIDDHRGPSAVDMSTEHINMAGGGHGSDMSPREDSSAQDAEPDMNMGADSDMEMDMSGPAGIALAEGGEDRDGLEMDVTHLSMGPLLAGWPADLVLHCTLHGDVVADAHAERLPRTWRVEEPPQVALLLDDAERLLSLAGWGPVAQELARLRNDLLEGATPHHVASRLRRAAARVRRSRTLRWSLKGITTIGGTLVRDRLLEWLDAAQTILESPDASPSGRAHPSPAVTAAGIRLAVLGQEIAATRLVIAALGTQPTNLIAAVAHE